MLHDAIHLTQRVLLHFQNVTDTGDIAHCLHQTFQCAFIGEYCFDVQLVPIFMHHNIGVNIAQYVTQIFRQLAYKATPHRFTFYGDL